MNSTPGNGFSGAIVWLCSGVRVLAWFVLCGVCGLVRSAGPFLRGLVVLEGRMGRVMRMSMFGALLGFEATSLLAVLLLVGWGGWVLGVSVFVLCLPARCPGGWSLWLVEGCRGWGCGVVVWELYSEREHLADKMSCACLSWVCVVFESCL